ncbi:MAG: glycosyltransferase family 2 protein [Candidatus Choladocola sp.]|nr:glycosyltransferase family 2 protein [Candidatus Choladocola sp.]
MEHSPVLYIVIPCYNEEAVLPVTAPMFLEELHLLIEKKMISEDSRIMFVNDGSRDDTWNIIRLLAKEDPHYIGISQSRNRGHQNAVLAGLMEAKDRCDITISIDCDGQDDISAMTEMVKQYAQGNEIVYGVRSSRATDTFFKRFTAESFYKLLKWMGVEVVYNHADYRLISSRVLQELAEFKEVNIYLRGMVPLVGFKSTTVSYERHERLAGDSHYPLSKMLGLAFDGITSMSIKPIRMIASFGVFVSILSFLYIIWIVIQFFMGWTVRGWASMCAIVCLMGGLQLICAGVIGEYIGKIYLETKARPRYIISERTYDTGDVTNAISQKETE